MLAAVEPFALSALKYAVLALLFLFIWRAMRWVVRGLNVERTPSRGTVANTPARQTILLVHQDGSKPFPYRLEGATTIGRAAECELRLDDTYVSQQHARIFDRSGNWFVEDLGSTNGTYVGSARITQPTTIALGTKIRIGKTTLELRK